MLKVTIHSLLVILLLYLTAPSPQAQNADGILGIWWTPEKTSRIKLFKENDEYFGKLVWLKNPKDENGNIKRDNKHPDPSKRGRPYNGMIVLKGLKCTGKNQLEGGTLYDPSTGKEYSSHLSLEDENTLRIRGYYGFSLFGRTEYLERYQEKDVTGNTED